jgi:hypothetical protein
MVKEGWNEALDDVKTRVTDNYKLGLAEKAKEHKELAEEDLFPGDSPIAARVTSVVLLSPPAMLLTILLQCY